MNILISGYYGFDNAGDELILDSIIIETRKNIKGAEISVLSANPLKTASVHSVKAFNRWNPSSVFKAVSACDVLISGGGGLFQDKTSSLSLYYYLAVMLLAKLLGKKVMVFSVGISEMKLFNPAVMKLAMSKADFITVRNPESIACLGKGEILKRADVTADIVFTRSVAPRKLAFNKPNVAFILRPPIRGRHSPEIFAKFADSIGQLLSANIIFVPFHLPYDYPYSLKVMNMMRLTPRIALWEEPKQLFEIFSNIDLVVSQRLHGLILSTLYGIPMVGVFEDSKLTRFLNEIGQKNLSNISDENIYSVLASLNDLWVWKDDFQKKLLGVLPSIKLRAAKNIMHLKDVINTI